jgi:hypothetical protein
MPCLCFVIYADIECNIVPGRAWKQFGNGGFGIEGILGLEKTLMAESVLANSYNYLLATAILETKVLH